MGDGIVEWAFSAIQSADQELRGDLTALRGNSRNHCRNDPYGRRFVNEVALNTVGPGGIRMQSQVRTGDDAADLAWNAEVEAAWLGWAEDKVTADGRMDWWQLLTHVATTEPQDGEILIRMLPGFADNPYGFALQVIDPDQLDHTLNRPAAFNSAGQRIQNAIRMGVEVNEWGKPVAYWIHPTHPTDRQQYGVQRFDPVRVPAHLMIHDYLSVRVGQTRGVPWLAPVLRRGRLRDSFEEAAVVNARIGASKIGLLQEEPSAVLDPNDDEDEEEAGGGAPPFSMDPEPGTWEILPVGVKPVENGWNPLYPNGEYEPFVRASLGAEAAGMLISYMTLTGDLKQTSFSSGRIGLLSERDMWRVAHRRKIANICRPVMRAWAPWARTSGMLRVPEAVFPADRPPVRWQGRGWQWVDPKNDVTAQSAAVDNIMGSRTLSLGEQGIDFEDVAQDIAREEAIMERLKIKPRSPAAAQQPAPADAGATNPDAEEDE
jgi:lambda family phage portal protein